MVQGFLLARPQLAPADFKIFKRAEQFSRINIKPTIVAATAISAPEVWIESKSASATVSIGSATTSRARTFGRRQVMP
jgi:hypothetical protein